jgi:PhnB protein
MTAECGSNKEADTLYAKLSAGGNATHPMKDEFFGYYGDLTDKFGIRWMISHMKPQS